MSIEAKDTSIEIGDKYLELATFEWITGIQANELFISHKYFEGKHYEEIHGTAEFIKEISLGYLNEENEFVYGFNDIKLEILKADIDLKECALLNLKEHKSYKANLSDHLSDCLGKGISHLSIHDTSTKCILILEEKHFEKLIAILKSDSLRLFSFFVDYMSVYSNKANLSSDYKSFYIVKNKNSAYPNLNSTFGPIKQLYIESNEWKLNDQTQSINTLKENLASKNENCVVNQIKALKKQIIASTVLIILFLIIF